MQFLKQSPSILFLALFFFFFTLSKCTRWFLRHTTFYEMLVHNKADISTVFFFLTSSNYFVTMLACLHATVIAAGQGITIYKNTKKNFSNL